MKIPEFKRSGIRLIAEFRGIPNRFPNQETDTFKKSDKSSNKVKKGKKSPATNSTVRVPKKVHFEKHCNLCKKHGGAHTMHNTSECRRFENDGKEKSSFRATKKGGYNQNPVNQNFAQLTNKIKYCLHFLWLGFDPISGQYITKLFDVRCTE